MATEKQLAAIERSALTRIEQIHRKIAEVAHLCRGSLSTRMKMCGRSACRCARDPAGRHGPYYEWAFMEGKSQVHRQVTPRQAALIERGIKNHKRVLGLIRRWEAETRRVIEAQNSPKPRR